MNRKQNGLTTTGVLASLGLVACLALPLVSPAATLQLATAPLATASNTQVLPNVFLMMDDSGSMGWEYMPDDVSNFAGNYGYASSQCNGVYYDPTITYTAPVKYDGTSYSNSTFTSAWDDGYNTGNGNIDLSANFNTGGFGNQAAFYFAYSGSQNTSVLRNYYNASSTFYLECNSTPTTITVSGSGSTVVNSVVVNTTTITSGATAASTSTSTVASNLASAITQAGYSASAAGSVVTINPPSAGVGFTPVVNKTGTMTFTVSNAFSQGSAVFKKVIVSASSGPGSTDERTNFANWYSYYRTRINMMKTATGLAFNPISTKYRVGFATMNNNGGSDFVNLATFDLTQRQAWYSKLYGTSAGSSTPLLGALADIGKMYAHKLTTKNTVAVNDPVQYSCQQNFTILTTDGFWNSQSGDTQLDGVTPVGNRDGDASVTPRPMYDGGAGGFTITYTRNFYSTSSSGCGGGKRRLKTQPQIGSCQVAVAGASCTPSNWSSNGGPTYGSCVSSVILPSPNPSNPVQSGSAVASTIGGSSNSLSDVAMYYYQTDLRTTALGNCTGAVTGENVCDPNNVFTTNIDNQNQQHMTTFTLGLGARGRMAYSASYLTDTSGDFFSVKLGSTASSTATPPVCPWQLDGTVCNWPIPDVAGVPENIDDLWHAAIDGHGAYFSATNPATLALGLSNALTGINARQGAGAAAASSTLNPVIGDNLSFVASYTTIKWMGNLEARGVNTNTGAVDANAIWCAEDVAAGSCSTPSTQIFSNDPTFPSSISTGNTLTAYCKTPGSVICTGGIPVGTDCYVPMQTTCHGTLKAMVTAGSRKILTSDGVAPSPALTNFDATYAGAHSADFDVTKLSQYPAYTAAQKANATPANLVNYLRGQSGYENSGTIAATDLFRPRAAVMGDPLESEPFYIKAPPFGYPYSGYSAFASANAGRAPTVYIGTNDGMLHAFDASPTPSPVNGGTGTGGLERWAYVPSMVVPNMWYLADYAYAHANYVNGSPNVADICTATDCSTATASDWRTILVSGLNGGGRGYFALDVTDPANPALLWEFTTTTGKGKVQDDDVGFGFGRPVVAQKADGKWVVLVTSGYNNVNPGTGGEFLFVLDAAKGTIISKIATGAVSATTPGGLGKVAAWNDSPTGNQAGYVYGGDLLGNLWRFNINDTSTPAAIGTGSSILFATLFSDAAGSVPQPITTIPELGKIANKRVVFIGTGKYLEQSDLTTNQVQSFYAIKDDETGATLVNPRNTLVKQTMVDSGNTRTISASPVDFSTGRGWYIDFPDLATTSGAGGERQNIDPKLIQGTLVVPTTVPNASACSPGGSSWLNFFCYDTGAACAAAVHYDATIVGTNVTYIGGEALISVVTSDNPTPTISGPPLQPPPNRGFGGNRIIWRELFTQ